jgi:outer membrane lipoprotein SlyB
MYGDPMQDAEGDPRTRIVLSERCLQKASPVLTVCTRVGAFVGATVGVTVGANVGVPVGPFVGTAVGAFVGVDVMSKQA